MAQGPRFQTFERKVLHRYHQGRYADAFAPAGQG